MPRQLRMRHRTEYRYDRPVTLHRHRLMLRPRDGHDLRLDNALLTITPRATLRWHFDTFGNSIAEATFDQPSDRLLIESTLKLRRYASDPAPRPEGPHDCPYPFRYADEDRTDLSPYLPMQNPGDRDTLDAWLAQVLTNRPANAFAFLRSLSEAIHHAIPYSPRDEMGTQSAAETIRFGLGTCRDFAFLFMEAARSLGFAARFVTGYLDDAPTGGSAPQGGGATHAWAEAFIPGQGWVEFDPTNRIVAGGALIRVATTRTPAQASPVSLSFEGGTFLGLTVSVQVTEDPGA